MSVLVTLLIGVILVAAFVAAALWFLGKL